MPDWFVCSDGARLHVREDGDPLAAVTLVLLHCYALDLRAWDPLVAELDRLPPVRVVRFDLRGHGMSSPARADASVARLADDLAELIACRVPDGPVVLAGHSLGGMTLLAMADRHPDVVEHRVAGAVLLATSGGEMGELRLGLPAPLAGAALQMERWGVAAAGALGCRTLPVPPWVMHPFTRWLAFGSGAGDDVVAEVSAIAADCRLDVMRTLRRTFGDYDARLALITFDRIPVVVAVGDEDRITPVRHSAVIARWLPGAKLVVLPGAGHMLVHERTTSVVELLGDLLEDAGTVWRRSVADGLRPAA